jgi:hypothetical protein
VNTPEAEADVLRALGRSKPNAIRIKLVEEALSSKWEGTQSIALQTLAQWGDRSFAQLVRAFLEQAFQKKDAWAIRGVAIDTLAKLVGPKDVDWLAEFVRMRTDSLERYELRPLIARLSELKR